MMDNQLNPEERKKLSPQAAEHYEAALFAQRHPEFYPCPDNATAMVEYLQSRKMPCTFENFEKAFTALKKQHRIMPGAEALELMTGEEVKELSEKVGVPVRDFRGRIIGYELPASLTHRSEDAPRVGGSEGQEFREWCRAEGIPEPEGQ